MDLIAVVSTDEDVWELKVRGQLMNETWSNIGIIWAPYTENPGKKNFTFQTHFGLTGFIKKAIDVHESRFFQP